MPDGIRIDKWLWHARFFKTRTLAQAHVTGGKIRVNGDRISKANHVVRLRDVLTFVKAKEVRVIEVVAIGERRGPASEAQQLYNDLSPPAAKSTSDNGAEGLGVANRERGSGRPTKKERRETDRLRGD